MSFLANWAAMFAARLLPPLFGFAINVGIARAFGAHGLGQYVYLTSLLLVFQAVAGAGMSLLLVREMAARPEEAASLLARGRVIGLLSGSLAMLAFAGLTFGRGDPETSHAAYVLALSLVPSAWITAQEAYLVAQHRHHLVTLIAAAENTVKLLLAAAVFLGGGGLVGLCAAISVSRLGALLLGRRLLASSGAAAAWRVDGKATWALARALPPFAAMLVLAMLYFRVDVLVLQALRPEAETGLYGAALTLYSVAILLPESALSAVFPRLARAFHARHDGFARGTWLAAKLLAIGLVPVSLGMIALSQPLLAWVYGASFTGATLPLALLAASLPMHALNGAFGQALQASGEQRAAMWVAGGATLCHLGLTLALVGGLGLVGAPIAVLTSSSLAALTTGLLVHRRVAPLPSECRVAWAWTVLTITVPIALALGLAPDRALAGAALGIACLGLALVVGLLRPSSDLGEALALLRAPRAEAKA